MKLEKAISFVWSCLLAFILSISAACCMATAFRMEVSVWNLMLWCAAASVFCSICYTLPLGPVPLAASALIGGFLWRNGDLGEALESIFYRLSRQYDMAYGWGILRWSMRTADEMELTLQLGICILAILVAMAVSWAVCRQKPVWPGLLLSIAMLASCLVVTDTVPSLAWLVLLMFGVIMLMLTHSVRRQDAAQGNKLSAMAVIPVALALLLLFGLVPQKTYNGQKTAKAMVDAILHTELVENLFGRFVETGTTGSSVDGGIVQLDAVGVRLSSQAEVMKVNSTYTQKLYLRGRALDTYDGKTWTDSKQGTAQLTWPDYRELAFGGEVVISTKYAHRMMYLPYYVSTDLTQMTRGMENKKKLSQYSFTCALMPERSFYTHVADANWDPSRYTDYLHLSQEAKQWAEPLAQQIVDGITNPYLQAQAIGAYVRQSARYDTNTRRMPSSRDDFAQWFLNESETGYCVHFATAATVLLQAAGIPARYVTGYSIDAQRGFTAIVRAEDAHAWAEYWLPGFGWTILEATPAESEEVPSQVPQATTAPTQPQEQTLPQQTEHEETTQQTMPVQTTPGPKPTQPRVNLLPILWWGMGIAGAVAAVWLQYRLRRKMRVRKLREGSTNAQTIRCWAETVRLTRLLKQTPEEGLFAIAQKAKFSQHAITREELEQFHSFFAEAHGKLRRRSILHQVYYRLVLALY